MWTLKPERFTAVRSVLRHAWTLRQWLAKHCPDGNAEIALEGCTGWRYVAEELTAAGAVAHLADPAETAGLRGPKKRAKSDRTDARLLRTLLWEGRLPESAIPPTHVLELRTLGRLYCALMDERRAWQQRIHAQLFHQGCPPIRALLSQLGRDGVATAELSPAGRCYIEAALRRIDELTDEIEPLRTQLVSFAKRQPGCRALQRHYGVGPLCAVIIWAEIGDARRFSQLRSTGALCRTRRHRVFLRRQTLCRTSVPPRIACAAVGSLRGGQMRCSRRLTGLHLLSPGRRRARGRKQRNGKNPTLAVERKLLRRCYHTLRELGEVALAPPAPRTAGRLKCRVRVPCPPIT